MLHRLTHRGNSRVQVFQDGRPAVRQGQAHVPALALARLQPERIGELGWEQPDAQLLG